MIAAITLKALDPFGTGKLVLFQVTYDKVLLNAHSSRGCHLCERFQDWHAYELVFFLMLGVFGVYLLLVHGFASLLTCL
jgi:chloride channel 3/4/5